MCMDFEEAKLSRNLEDKDKNILKEAQYADQRES